MTGDGGLWADAGLRFAGLGHYYPRDQRKFGDEVTFDGRTWSGEQVAELGVRSLHVAQDDETVEFMAARAAESALGDADRGAADLDLVVLANWSDRQWIPELAPAVAQQLGADRALAFDVCGACTGFVHGVQVAASMLVANPRWRRAVVVAADRFTRRVRPGTRGRLVFGDAAGAVVLEKGGEAGLLDSVLDCDAAEADTVAARAPEGWLRPRPELIDLAVRSSLDVADRLLSRNGVTVEQVSRLVPHPGNNAIHRGVRDGLNLREDQFLTNFHDRGNTGCASIPIALSEFRDSGHLRRGDLVLSTAVGSGWYFGGLLYRL